MPARREIDQKTRDALEVVAMCVAVVDCANCPINAVMRRRAVDCVQFQDRYPAEALKLAEEWRKEHAYGEVVADH